MNRAAAIAINVRAMASRVSGAGRAAAALRTARLAGDSLLVMALLLTVLFIAVSPAAQSKGHQLTDGSGSGCLRNGRQTSCTPSTGLSECQANASPQGVGASCRTVLQRMPCKVSRIQVIQPPILHQFFSCVIFRKADAVNLRVSAGREIAGRPYLNGGRGDEKRR